MIEDIKDIDNSRIAHPKKPTIEIDGKLYHPQDVYCMRNGDFYSKIDIYKIRKER